MKLLKSNEIFIYCVGFPFAMSHKTLNDNIKSFSDQMDARLNALPPEQQQQYLEGLVHAFDAVTRFTQPDQLTPIEREEFIGSVKGWAYSCAYHLHLDPETHMRGLVETAAEGIAKAYNFAAKVQAMFGLPLTADQLMRLEQVNSLYQMKLYQMKKK